MSPLKRFRTLIVLGLVHLGLPAFAQSGLYTPNAGVPERVALMDAMRAAQGSRAQFMVNYLKVFKVAGAAVAGAELSPANPKNDVDALSGGIVFYEQINGRWKAQYISGQDGANSCADFTRAADVVIRRITSIGAPKDVMPPRFWTEYSLARKAALGNGTESNDCGGFVSYF